MKQSVTVINVPFVDDTIRFCRVVLSSDGHTKTSLGPNKAPWESERCERLCRDVLYRSVRITTAD